MNDTSDGFEATDDEMLIAEISDEALEAAAGMARRHGAAFSVALCTGQDNCPLRGN